MSNAEPPEGDSPEPAVDADGRSFERRKIVDLTRIDKGEPERRDVWRNRRTLGESSPDPDGPAGRSGQAGEPDAE